jgi:hypothetical protein
MQGNHYLKSLLGCKVKALFCDEGQTKKVIGLLVEVSDRYFVVNDVVIGLGEGFIACIPVRCKENLAKEV